MAKWKVGPWMPAELHARLVTGLGARDGDTIIVDGDGRVGLGRTASVDLSEEITSLLPRCPLVGQFPSDRESRSDSSAALSPTGGGEPFAAGALGMSRSRSFPESREETAEHVLELSRGDLPAFL